METEYDRDYFECGLVAGKSLYTDYRWIYELTLPMAMTIIDLLELKPWHTILDFGCAKGFLVKALRMLHRQVFGCDISEYAIEFADPEAKQYLWLTKSGEKAPLNKFDWVIAKDVLEHIGGEEIVNTLKILRDHSDSMFAIIPLGENDKFIVPAYELDRTHKLAKSVEWWERAFNQAGWYVKRFEYRIAGLKENWASWKNGNGFWILA